MLELARSGSPEGLWLRAERQTRGRGRLGRAWEAPVGNLSASTLVRIRAWEPPTATLALVAAVALEETATLYLARAGGGDRLQLKWPNDLVLGSAKVSGILLERTDDAVVIGIGVNLAAHPDLPDRLTTSLAAHGAQIEPGPFLETLAEAFARWLSRWRGEGLAPVRARWLERAHPIGTALTANLPDGTAFDGLFDGLDPDGALILRLASGERRVIHAGDIFLL